MRGGGESREEERAVLTMVPIRGFQAGLWTRALIVLLMVGSGLWEKRVSTK